MFNKRMRAGFMVGATALILAGCGSTPKALTVDDKSRLDSQVSSAIADIKTTDPGMDKFFREAYGYAVFPNVQAGAIIVGGAHGDGEVFQGGNLVGYADVSQANVGAQLGGQAYAQFVFFKDSGAFAQFTTGQYQFDAKASAVAASAGASTSADYKQGVVVFTQAQGGLMAQAAVGGQKFRYVAK